MLFVLAHERSLVVSIERIPEERLFSHHDISNESGKGFPSLDIMIPEEQEPVKRFATGWHSANLY
jgi:hypothetical protein